MPRNNWFQFKQFRIHQEHCAMKVTTDACLLGSVAKVKHSKSILDIGAGTGLLSLMVAQRSQGNITAIEIDPSAAQQCHCNFTESPWKERLAIIQQDIQTFSTNDHPLFDTIISNPPFFEKSTPTPNTQKTMARHTCSLSYHDLALAITRCLSCTGYAWVLLPSDSSSHFITAAENTGLHVFRTIHVRSSQQHPEHRHILVLQKHKVTHPIHTGLDIYRQHPVYSEQAHQLLQPYYLYL